jgi:hypothetical protein
MDASSINTSTLSKAGVSVQGTVSYSGTTAVYPQQFLSG